MSRVNEGISEEVAVELKPADGEDATSYAERVSEVKTRLRAEGYSVDPGWLLPGEDGPCGALERTKMLRPHQQPTPPKETTMSKPEPSLSAGSRLQSLRNRAEDALEDFDRSERALYRPDGEKKLSEAEHAEQHAALAEKLSEVVEDAVARAEADAGTYDAEALAQSYRSPADGLSPADRDRLTASAAFVKEDLEMLSHEERAERLRAVAGGTDEVSKRLHARYGRFQTRRLEQDLARGDSPDSEADSARLRELTGLVESLEADTADPQAVERRERAAQAARDSRSFAGEMRSRRLAADGTEAEARERAAEATRAAF